MQLPLPWHGLSIPSRERGRPATSCTIIEPEHFDGVSDLICPSSSSVRRMTAKPPLLLTLHLHSTPEHRENGPRGNVKMAGQRQAEAGDLGPYPRYLRIGGCRVLTPGCCSGMARRARGEPCATARGLTEPAAGTQQVLRVALVTAAGASPWQQLARGPSQRQGLVPR